MDWLLAIRRDRGELLRIVLGLVAMLPDGAVTRRVYLTVLSVLRPAESSLRRLIAVAAAGMVVETDAARAKPSGVIPHGTGDRVPVFGLFDPRRNVDPKARRVPGFGPNIRGLNGNAASPPAQRAVTPDDVVDTTRLRQRVAALLAAADDIPGQAKRLARVLARGRSRWRQVMRPGRPPGHVARGRRPVDLLLVECHALALMALHPPEP